MGKAVGILVWLLVIGVVVMFLAHSYWQPSWWFPQGISAHAAEYDSQFSLTLVVVAVAFILASARSDMWCFDLGPTERARLLIPTETISWKQPGRLLLWLCLPLSR